MSRLSIVALLVVVCFGCAAYESIPDVKNNPGRHKTVQSKFGYQASLKIAKDEFSALNCTIFPDLKTGECTFHGASLVVTAKYVDENSALVDLYTASSSFLWEEHLNRIANKLQ